MRRPRLSEICAPLVPQRKGMPHILPNSSDYTRAHGATWGMSLRINIFPGKVSSSVANVKGTQKGKVTCYARERVNKNKLF